MKNTFAILLVLTAAFTMPAQTAKKKTTPVAKAAAPPTIKPVVIPPTAVPNPDGTYSFTDKQGKHWTYTKTPFGISRTEDMGGAAAAMTIPKDQFITATENGDSYSFSRKTPFGVTKWDRKKTELNDEEHRVVEAGKTQVQQSNQ